MRVIYIVVFLITAVTVAQNNDLKPDYSLHYNTFDFDYEGYPVAYLVRHDLIVTSGLDNKAKSNELYCWEIHKNPDDISGLNEHIKKANLFSRFLNSIDQEMNIYVSEDGLSSYLSRATRGDKNQKIYKSTMNKKRYGKWEDITELSFIRDEYSYESPFFKEDSNTLFFASNIPGGYGGMDLYRIELNEDGTAIGDPINLGEGVNTSADENFPVFAKNDDSLYFSSNGHNTLGGYDFFLSTYENGSYARAMNLGESINTEFNEVSMVFTSANADKGFIGRSKTIDAMDFSK